MRIISGLHKGRRLMAPKNLPVRPTTDRAKESLFNILQHRVDFENLSLLDLFSGTGNISFEFASRGSKQITAVDQHFGCIKYINQIAEKLNFSITSVKSDVFKYLEHASAPTDIIFADPPYTFTNEEFKKLHQLILESSLFKVDSFLIIEHSKHTDLSNLEYFNTTKKYGSSAFSFFIKKADL